MMNLGKQWRLSNHGLLTTLTCSLDDDEVGYAFEGSIFFPLVQRLSGYTVS